MPVPLERPSDLSPGQRVALDAYAALLGLLAPINVLRLKWRARAEPLYGQAIGERFGRYPFMATTAGCVWVHAVSLGETRAAAALIDALRERRPGMRLLLTHGTATGREAGRGLLRDGDMQAWVPLDTPSAVRRFLVHFEPAVGVLMETEVWPVLIRESRDAGIPMVLASARLSERSLRRGSRVAAVLRPAIAALSAVLAQTEADAERLRQAGARQVQVCGNLKFDMTPEPALIERGLAWRAAVNRPIVMAAATREGEEASLLRTWTAGSAQAPRPLLLIVPRHPQRFDEVATLLQSAGLRFARRSTWGDTPTAEALQADVWLGDSLGEMPMYYAAASVALLGGSFEPLGGQNLIEAAACACPLVMGPHTFNFAEAAERALAAGAALRTPQIADGVSTSLALIADPARLAAMSDGAQAFASQHRGAARRMAVEIDRLMGI